MNISERQSIIIYYKKIIRIILLIMGWLGQRFITEDPVHMSIYHARSHNRVGITCD